MLIVYVSARVISENDFEIKVTVLIHTAPLLAFIDEFGSKSSLQVILINQIRLSAEILWFAFTALA